MTKSSVESVLLTRYSQELIDALLDAYKEVESNYAFKKWKPSELDAGHFVESVRRILEFEQTGHYTQIGTQLPRFTEQALKDYEKIVGDDSFRKLIPRVLFSIYAIRNSRGVGHVGKVSANEMDATIILYSVKWVLSELVRLVSNLSIPDTQKIVDELMERQIELLFKAGGATRIQLPGLKAEEEVLILLYDRDRQSDAELFKSIEYSDLSLFKSRILRKTLHTKKRLIIYGSDGICHLTGTGRVEAEKIWLQNK